MSKLVTLEQGSDTWHAWRNDKITASEVAALDGSNPWATPLQLFERKTGLIPPIEDNPAMAHGREHEEAARGAVEALLGMSFSPACFETDDGLIGASLDGIDLEHTTILELKAPPAGTESKLWQSMVAGEIPIYYYKQLQAQAYAAQQTQSVVFAVYCSTTGAVIQQTLDAAELRREFEETLLPLCAAFVTDLRNGIPPAPTDKDITQRDDEQWALCATKYRRAKQAADTAAQYLGEVKADLLKLADGRSSEGNGVRCTYYTVKGSVDSAKLTAAASDAGIDAEAFRKPGRQQTKITIQEEKSA